MEIDEIEKEIAQHYRKIHALKEMIAKQSEYPLAKSLVGKYFKHKNCYSCPTKPRDYWYVYSHVFEADGSMVSVLCFQSDSDGKASIEIKKHSVGGYFPNAHVEIEMVEYAKARQRFAEHVRKFLKK